MQLIILPNIQTSLAVVNRLKLMDSGAIHLMGSLPFDAKTKLIIRIVVASVHSWKRDKLLLQAPQKREVTIITFVIRAVFHVPWQTKVTQLHTVNCRHQHIPCCNVSAETNQASEILDLVNFVVNLAFGANQTANQTRITTNVILFLCFLFVINY